MANFNLNKVILGGRIVADPELKQTPSGVSVVRIRMAVNRRFGNRNAEQGESQADFFDVVAWRQTAEFVAKYFRKGSSVCVVGSIQTRTWQDQQGQKRYATEIVADEVNFVDARGEAGAGQSYTPDAYTAPAYSSNPGSAPNFEDHNTDDDLPF